MRLLGYFEPWGKDVYRNPSKSEVSEIIMRIRRFLCCISNLGAFLRCCPFKSLGFYDSQLGLKIWKV